MNTINKILIGVCGLIAGSIHSACGQEQISDHSDLPNIVLIMADDMGHESLGCNGSTEYNTPNLDQLAAHGLRFDHFYSQPLCTPSRVKIMTGKSNFRNYEDFGYLNPNQKTFGNLLKEAGYETCIAGKWQLNGLNHNNPGNQDTTRPYHFGFDEYCLWQLHHKRAEGERFADPLITQNGKDLPRDKDAYGPQVFADFITDFIDRKAGQPFFIYYPMVLVHSPFVPTPDSPEWADLSRRYENDTNYFADMVAFTDKIAGQIEAKLKEKGVWENTIFIFTGDNGTHPSIVTRTVNGDVKGGKGNTINSGNHVPMIISWPKKIKKGRVFQGVLDFADILPTLADVAEINPNSYSTDGKSFLSVLEGNHKPIKHEVFIHYTPRWGKNTDLHNRWVMDKEYKLYQDGRFYNTLIDPDEKNTLSTLTPNEQKIKEKFGAILQSKEKEFPYNWNKDKFIPGGSQGN
jgi:arylsulfatase A